MKKILVLSILLLGALLVSSCVEQQQIKQPQQKLSVAEEEEEALVVKATGVVSEVVVENLQFMPTDLIINVGDTVMWVNRDSVQNAEGKQFYISHTIMFQENGPEIFLPPGAKAQYTFLQPGVYYYASEYEMEDTRDERPDDRDRVVQGTITVQ